MSGPPVALLALALVGQVLLSGPTVPGPVAGLESKNRPTYVLVESKTRLMYTLVGRDPSSGPAWDGGLPAQDPPSAIPSPPLDALEAAVAEQLRDARRVLDAALTAGARGRERADAYGSLARLYHVYEFFESAEAAYREALRLAPGDVRWAHLLGYLYEQTGRFEEAAARFVAARRVAPDDHAAAIRLAWVYLGLNRSREARDAFQAAVDVFPALAQRGLGEVALREGRFSDAVTHLKAALDRAPQATSIYYSLAMAYRGLGRLDEAQSSLARRGAGDLAIGDPIVDGLHSLVRGERALVMRGRRAFEAGQFQQAAEAFERAVRDAPESVTARANLGLALARLGDTRRAAEQFDAALRRDPGSVIAHAGLGMLLSDQGRDAEAVAHLRTAFSQAPDDGSVSRALLRALLRLGRQDEAIEVLAKAGAVDPDDEDVVVGLSLLLATRERYREAVAVLEDAARRLPDSPATLTTLARLLASSPDRSVRDGRRALGLATVVHAAQPTPVHAETMALALAELGRCTEALDWMRRAVEGARRAADSKEAERLAAQVPRYTTASCAAPGR